MASSDGGRWHTRSSMLVLKRHFTFREMISGARKVPPNNTTLPFQAGRQPVRSHCLQRSRQLGDLLATHGVAIALCAR